MRGILFLKIASYEPLSNTRKLLIECFHVRKENCVLVINAKRCLLGQVKKTKYVSRPGCGKISERGYFIFFIYLFFYCKTALNTHIERDIWRILRAE